MPSFDKLKFTANGLALQAKAQAGSKLTFSKIKLGKGSLAGSVSNLTDLVNPVIEANIITGTLVDNVYTVQANATNDGLTEGFYWTELGLFAKDGTGKEVLYAYSSTTDETDYIPALAESAYLKRVKVAIVVGNATNIEITKRDDTYIDVLTFNEKVDEINASLSEISTALSDCVTTATLDEVKANIEEQINAILENLNGLQESHEKDMESIRTNYATTETLGEVNEVLEGHIEEANKSLSELENTVAENYEEFTNDIKSINNTVGSASISGIGDGTVKGAIAKLYKMVSAIPSITSGTANPSGGKDGDVYIQHE